MEAYAVIETGGKQYRVQQGDQLDVELLDGDAGDPGSDADARKSSTRCSNVEM